jgi:hypothetical protein
MFAENKGFVKAVALAFAFVTFGVAWEVTGSEGPRVAFSGPPAEVETYDFAEIVIRVTDPDVANPFTDASVEGHFAQEGREPVTVDGFCDSKDGSVFRIRFIAVTYDCTAAKEQLKLYVGTTTADVRMHKTVSYDRGPVGKGAGVLTVGHFHPAMRSNHSDRMFRGLIDEVRLFGSTFDGTGALSLDEIRTIYRSTN